jgi:drug/metabolite transporter (DMT)-like permease
LESNPLVGAFGLAGILTLTRAVSNRDDHRLTAFFGPFVAFLMFSTVVPTKWVSPKSAAHLALFLGVGLLAAGAQILQTLAYRHGSTHDEPFFMPYRCTPSKLLSGAPLVGWTRRMCA